MIEITTRGGGQVRILRPNSAISYSVGDTRLHVTIGGVEADVDFDSFRFGGWSGSNDWCIVSDMTTLRVDKVDVGWLLSKESELLGENNCRHYDVSGSFTRNVPCDLKSEPYYNDWHKLVTIPGQGSYPVLIGKPGDSISRDWPYLANVNKYQWIGKAWYLANTILYSAYHVAGSESINVHMDIEWNITDRYDQDKKLFAVREDVVWKIPYKDCTTVGSWALPLPSEVPPPTAPGIYYTLNPSDRRWLDYIDLMIRDEGGEDGDLTADAVESVRLTNSNTFLNVMELMSLPELASGLTKLTTKAALKSARSLVAATADTYLAYHYGLRLTVKDMKDVCAKIDKIDLERFTQTAGSQWSYDLDYPGRPGVKYHIQKRCKLILDAYTQEQLSVQENMKKLSRWFYEADLVPSISNIWDAIPMSFVVDWVFPLGDAFDRAENINYVKTLHFRRCFYSTKITWNFRDEFTTDSGYVYKGDLEFKYYQRDCRKTCVVPSQNVDHPQQGRPTHWLEASALFLSFLG